MSLLEQKFYYKNIETKSSHIDAIEEKKEINKYFHLMKENEYITYSIYVTVMLKKMTQHIRQYEEEIIGTKTNLPNKHGILIGPFLPLLGIQACNIAGTIQKHPP